VSRCCSSVDRGSRRPTLSSLGRRRFCESARFLGAALLFLACSTTVAFAWEQDVHEGLTQWLAEQAGFSADEAVQIGRGDQEIDDSRSTDAVTLVERVMVTGDVGASELVQRLHFPSFGPIPSAPDARKVTPLSFPTREAVEHEMELPNSAKPNDRAMEDFGRALHPFQDGWSHQGDPDPPAGGLHLNENLSFGHPVKRGGWLSHNADITHLHGDDTLDTSRETYSLLCRFHSHRSGKNESPPDWKALKPDVVTFASAETKSAKRDWFIAHGFPADEANRLVRGLSIEDGYFDSSSAMPRTTGAAPSHGPLAPELVEPYATAYGFLQAWIVEWDITMSVRRFVSVSDVSDQLKASGLATTEASGWLSKFLTAWLIADHGLVNRDGHGWPGTEGYQLLPGSPQQAELKAASQKSYRPLKFSKLEEAIRGQFPGSIFDLVSLAPIVPGEARCAVMFSFRHTPHDGIVLLMTRKDHVWRITNFLWVTA